MNYPALPRLGHKEKPELWPVCQGNAEIFLFLLCSPASMESEARMIPNTKATKAEKIFS